MTDFLTGLPDRHRLHLALPTYASQANAAHPLALLLLKLKDFDMWQERLTPLAADALLKLTADVIRQEAPEQALTVRWSHDTFGLLLPVHTVWQAEDAAEQLREALRQFPLPPAFEALSISPDLTSGAASLPPCDVLGMLREAERQLARAEGGMFNRLLSQPEEIAPGCSRAAADAYIYLVSRYLPHSDAYLRRHGEMTAGFAQEVARQLGLGDTALSELEMAAAFADIAMAEAAGSALNKPGSLTMGEFNRIKRHPLFAAELARELNLPAGVIEAVRCHHERVDGAGYPNRLRGEEIPLAASILGCCGAYAAMLLPRPYRPARKIYSIRAELCNLSNKAWPHEVVREVIGLCPPSAARARYNADRDLLPSTVPLW